MRGDSEGFVAGRQFGPYRLDRLLGRGGMGEVYLAHDSGHQRDVAVKLLLESLSTDPEYRARFEREARIAAGLREQHIIPIHHYGEIDNRLYIDMRLVEGEDLRKLLYREGPLDPSRAVGIVQQVAAALDAAHAAGLVHRDVKPANVLLAGTPTAGTDSVYLADFGIARPSASNTRLTLTGAAVGTPDYMAPERFTAGSVDHRTDIYALGCMLYEMLSGRKPFSGDEFMALLYQHVNAEPPKPSAVTANVPAGMDAVIRTSMAKDPASRYRSAGDLAAAAQAALLPATPTRGNGARPGTTPVRHGQWRPLAAGRRWPRWFYEVDGAIRQAPTQVWPTATDYVEAVQTSTEVLAHAGLHGVHIQRNLLGMPASSSGQNAVVFELGHAEGPLALRCFTRSPRDAGARYRALAPALASAACDVVAPARWVDSAIKVDDAWWPAVVMPWVPGLPLNTVVEDLLDRPRGIRRLADTWRVTVTELAGAGLAHGDLQCGNILVDQDGAPRLVDLDGFYVPSLARPAAELGHPDYQHPGRSVRDWGPDMDAFSALAIYLSLRALATDPDLWRFNSAENLILTREDYEQPGRTPVWRRLGTNPDADVVRLAERLAHYCRSAPPTLAEALDQLDNEGGRAAIIRTAPAPPAAQTRTQISSPLVTGKWWNDEDDAIVEDDIEPAVGPYAGGWFGRNSITSGLTSGLLCAVVIVLIYGTVGSTIPPIGQAPLLIVLAGAILTAGLAAVPQATMGAWSSATRRGLAGAVLGATLAIAAFGCFELIAYPVMGAGRAPLLLIVAWAFCAMSIGVAAGLVRRSRRAVVSGFLGGAIGGLAGGLVHWASGPTLGGEGETVVVTIDVQQPPTFVAIFLACAVIGLAIGVVDRARRRAWLTVIEGRLRGRETIIDRPEVTIGSLSTATLRLSGDAGVHRVHAILSADGEGYQLLCQARMEVNGMACTSSAPFPLRSGDVLRIGGSFVRFEHRNPR